ncbi:alginate export family protein [Reichenbachiella ulvae]|uniref:Alginate export family protein n=1 Tax=Reichenbachiella ulvae TaxID=2980104 RepID=A0ABT3CP42_9BACT|nr:alginate export family protein [Reichenbachiella ulvae]MCV9385511.1 alginate export family protein [Reichenbachiella ulvae]
MKTLQKLIFITLGMVFWSQLTFGQEEQTFTMQGEYRLNPLYSHGFRIPMYGDRTDEGYVSQRTRIIMNYEKKGDLSTEFILQDLRAWGTYRNNGQAGNLSIFRAWVEKELVDGLSVKFGRQGFIYGDQYILGGLNWGGNMAHDAALLKYEKNGYKVHAAFAYNTTGFDLEQQNYPLANHKNMQFLWASKKTDRLNANFVFMNRGLEKPNDELDIRYNHTTGLNIGYKINDQLSVKGIGYYQFGKDTVGLGKDISAYLYSAQVKFSPNKKLSFTLGTDVVSGTSTANASDPNYNKKNNFDILFGLRHGYYGYLDYFYTKLWPVTGVEDYYFKAKIQTSPKSSMDVHWHAFFSNAQVSSSDLSTTFDDYYGSELDLRWHYKQSNNMKVTLGYSHMWVTDTYLSYYNADSSDGSSTVYAVIVVKPTFLNMSF